MRVTGGSRVQTTFVDALLPNQVRQISPRTPEVGRPEVGQFRPGSSIDYAHSRRSAGLRGGWRIR